MLKADELAVAVALHATAENGAFQEVERGEQRRRAVTNVVMGLLGGIPLDERIGTRSLQRLDLALLVDRQDHGMSRTMHVEADDVLDLLCEGRIVRALEGANAMLCRWWASQMRWTERSEMPTVSSTARPVFPRPPKN